MRMASTRKNSPREPGLSDNNITLACDRPCLWPMDITRKSWLTPTAIFQAACTMPSGTSTRITSTGRSGNPQLGKFDKNDRDALDQYRQRPELRSRGTFIARSDGPRIFPTAARLCLCPSRPMTSPPMAVGGIFMGDGSGGFVSDLRRAGFMHPAPEQSGVATNRTSTSALRQEQAKLYQRHPDRSDR